MSPSFRSAADFFSTSLMRAWKSGRLRLEAMEYSARSIQGRGVGLHQLAPFLGRIGLVPTPPEDPSADRYRFTMLRGARTSAGIWRMTCTAASDNE